MKQKLYYQKQFPHFTKTMLLLLLSFIFITALYAQERTISGIITDQSGATLPGVNVVIKNTTNGVITDINGKYSLKVPDNNTVLVFSFVGYITQEIIVGEQLAINVSLVESIKEIDQVVVVGYGVQKRSDLTGSVASVSGSKLSEIPIAGIDQALQGKAAGVNIIPKTGRPGSGVDIQIRGITSINGSTPLIIIDGIPAVVADISRQSKTDPLSQLNPNDIESVEVLKDASSAAIYGASGGNGVILITTKKGKEGKMITNLNIYRGTESIIKKIPLMNSQQWLEVLEEKNPNGGIPYTYKPDTLKTYDWQDIMFKPALTENYDLSFTGGSEKSNFMISTSYNKQNGIVKSSDNERFTIRVNSEHKMTKNITFDEKVSYVNTVNSGFEDREWQGYYQNPIMNALIMVPYLPAYNPKHQPAWGDSLKWTNGEDTMQFGTVTNPFVALDMKNRKKRNNDFEGNFGLNIELLKGLTYTTRFDGKLGFFDDKEYKKTYYASGTDSRPQNELRQAMRRDISWNFQNIITYNSTIMNDHNFTIMAGCEASRWYWYDMSGLRTDMSSDMPNMLYFVKSTNDTLDRQIPTGTGDEGRFYRYFGRLNYDYKGKYLLTVNISQDYASNFGPNNRKGTFPSFSVGWKFTQEEFMKNQSLLSFGKLRFGYGQTGANAFPGTPYLTNVLTPLTFKYSYNDRTSQIGAGPVQIANPDLKWESVNMTNIGIDLGLFRNVLNITAEYFEKVNDGMIMLKELPAIAGTTSMGSAFDLADANPYVNIGSVRNRGLEFSLELKKKEGDLKGSFEMNLGIVRNKVLKLSTDSLQYGSVHNVTPITLTREGGSISDFWGYKTNGLFRETDPQVYNNKAKKVVFTNQPYTIDATTNDTTYAQPNAKAGDFRFVDANNDGRFNSEDKVILGSPLPKFSFGFSFNLEYKIFDLSAVFYGTYGNKVFNGTKQYLYYYQENSNHCAAFANRYKEEVVKDGLVVVKANKNTNLPRSTSGNYATPSDFFIEDGSYLRLQNLQIGISLPKLLTSKLKVEKFRIYFGAKNLFTITNYTGFSPDNSGVNNTSSGSGGVMAQGIDIGTYPLTRMYFIGINLQF